MVRLSIASRTVHNSSCLSFWTPIIDNFWEQNEGVQLTCIPACQRPPWTPTNQNKVTNLPDFCAFLWQYNVPIILRHFSNQINKGRAVNLWEDLVCRWMPLADACDLKERRLAEWPGHLHLSVNYSYIALLQIYSRTMDTFLVEQYCNDVMQHSWSIFSRLHRTVSSLWFCALIIEMLILQQRFSVLSRNITDSLSEVTQQSVQL